MSIPAPLSTWKTPEKLRPAMAQGMVSRPAEVDAVGNKKWVKYNSQRLTTGQIWLTLNKGAANSP
jgi:hypothetical protein